MDSIECIRSFAALNKIVPTRSCMGNDTSQFAVLVENDSVRTGTPTIIRLEIMHDGKLIVGPCDLETKPFIVVVRVRVVVRSLGPAGLEE